MRLRLPATATSRAMAELRAEVHRLTAAVETLAANERKNAEQIKKLRDALSEAAAGWRGALQTTERDGEQFRRLIERQQAAEKERQRVLERMQAAQRTDAKWRKIFNNQISALIRHVCLPMNLLPMPQALNARRFRLRSQNEEDGVLLAVLERAGWGGRRFVEIGSGKSGGNAAVLARDCGWAGLMIELSLDAVERARAKFAANRHVRVVAQRVTPANVNAVLAEHGYDGAVDVLSIDIDSYDYWILEALAVSPRILILEYNALFGAERSITIPPDQSLSAAPKGYHGASLAALTKLARRKGYRLITCENAGVNAFYLREDVVPELTEVPVATAFMPLRNRADLEDALVERDIFETLEAEGLPLVEV